MVIALDNTFLSLVLRPGSRPRPCPKTGKPVEHCEQRVEALIDTHSESGDTVLIPAPCLAELLVAVPDVSKVVHQIEQSPVFEPASFDTRCAIELAVVTRAAVDSGDKKSGIDADWQKIKLDRQIAVIAKVGKAQIFYTDDDDQTAFAEHLGLQVKHTWDLPLPHSYSQRKLGLQNTDDEK